MTFEEILDQAMAMLQRRGRVAYRTLKVQFNLDDDALEALKDELLYAQQVARDEDGRVLVWCGGSATTSAPVPTAALPVPPPTLQEPTPLRIAPVSIAPHTPEAERRQLTVLFCDLADSTRLARELDPEDLREVIRAYQATCVAVIQRFAGYVAQYLGDGLLVYFGYPQAHEDDAQRAVRTGLGMLAAMGTLNTRLVRDKGVRLAVRVGIHTGLVVVGEMGSGDRHEHLALGDTPALAARLQGLAAPDTVVLSDGTYRLVQGYFTWQALGPQTLKGIDTPVQAYQVVGESVAQSRLDVAGVTGLTPLVGREAEVTLLRERWAQSRDGLGQVVVLSGEAGIGKSRLGRVLTERVVDEHTAQLTFRCSPYHTNSALYPVIEHFQRRLQWQRNAPPEATLATLEQAVQAARLPLAEVVPLVAALLSLPVPEQYPPLTLSPQGQKQKTQEALVAWLLAEAAQQPVLAVWEDLHWADPSTLELLGLVLDQVPTARLFLVLTCRPEFQPPWALRSYVTPLILTRLTRPQVEEMVLRITGGKPLPTEVLAQVVAKTDGIPLFVEELVKTTLEAGLVREEAGRYVLTGPLPPLAIPATLQDALMARLDRLAAVKAVAQLGAVLGREFAYALLRAVAPLDEASLQQALARLVEAELLYQRGLPPQMTYVFKHALIQEAAYQSLLKSTRQQVHQQVAQALAAQFPETVATQPELVAQHYTEAGCTAQAIPYWQAAGQQALQRSANPEAVQHLTTGLALLATLPDTPARAQQELDLQLALGSALIATRGYAAPEVEQTYARARALCQQVGDTPQLFPALQGLCQFYYGQGALSTARGLGEQLYRLAQRETVSTHLLEAHDALGSTLFYLGDYAAAWTHLEQGIACTDPTAERALALHHGVAPGVRCLAIAANVLWCLGYPAQAMRRSQEALALAQELAHPYSLALAQFWAAYLHCRRREALAVQMQTETGLTLATAQGFALWVEVGKCWRGWALALQGQSAVGLAQLHQGLAAVLATGWTLGQPSCLVLLADAAGHAGQVAEGLRFLAEALTAFEANERGDGLVEAYRLQGELLLHAECGRCGMRHWQKNASSRPWL